MHVLIYLSDCIQTAIKAMIGLLLINLGIALIVGMLVLLSTLFN